ncbi:virulence RhuM family protein [Micromonospora sp. DH14]|uniref:virulence RhuM family protein n=1 Tax=Micromonospora sp. DH14 TaxID=3040120 RepID=UPI0024414A2E|nr:virulence RhuM family protein [Micromonospora sp. DH14]MDG9673441.1 virulence RhuM family protein [Micromonospora sp. DH14]
MTDPAGELILYRADDGGSVVQLRATNGTVWLTQAQMAELYGTSVPNIVQIMRRVLADEEVTEATINSELVVRFEGGREVRREVKVYNLDMILAVGYRVTTPRAVQFRQWATTVLTEYLVKGFAIQDERLKDVTAADYFDELLERIRDIRASEKRFYQKVRDIFATTSADYSGASDTAKTFFATIQNKLLYAVTGHSAGELMVKRADAESPTMGLTTWRGPQVRKADTTISKNYLTADEISELNRLTTMFLDFAEDRARRRQQILMAEWVQRADAFLTFNERQVLAGAGGISSAAAEAQVGQVYADYDNRRRALQAEEARRQEERDLAELLEIERRDRHGGGSLDQDASAG